MAWRVADRNGMDGLWCHMRTNCWRCTGFSCCCLKALVLSLCLNAGLTLGAVTDHPKMRRVRAALLCSCMPFFFESEDFPFTAISFITLNAACIIRPHDLLVRFELANFHFFIRSFAQVNACLLRSPALSHHFLLLLSRSGYCSTFGIVVVSITLAGLFAGGVLSLTAPIVVLSLMLCRRIPSFMNLRLS